MIKNAHDIITKHIQIDHELLDNGRRYIPEWWLFLDLSFLYKLCWREAGTIVYVSPLSGISELSVWSHLSISSLGLLLPSPVAFSVLFLFCYWPIHLLFYSPKPCLFEREWVFCMAFVVMFVAVRRWVHSLVVCLLTLPYRHWYLPWLQWSMINQLYLVLSEIIVLVSWT